MLSLAIKIFVCMYFLKVCACTLQSTFYFSFQVTYNQLLFSVLLEFKELPVIENNQYIVLRLYVPRRLKQSLHLTVRIRIPSVCLCQLIREQQVKLWKYLLNIILWI